MKDGAYKRTHTKKINHFILAHGFKENDVDIHLNAVMILPVPQILRHRSANKRVSLYLLNLAVVLLSQVKSLRIQSC